MGKKKSGAKPVKMNMQEFLSDFSGKTTLPSGPAARAEGDDGRLYGNRRNRREEEVSRSDGDNNWRGGGGGGGFAQDNSYGKGGGFGGGYGDRDRYQSRSDAAPSWRGGLSSQDDERYASSRSRFGDRNDAPPPRPLGERKKLVLKARSTNVPTDAAAAATASSIFGAAKPVQVKEAPISEEARKKKEWEEKFKKSSDKMRAKYGGASAAQGETEASTSTSTNKEHTEAADEAPKEPEPEAPKEPSAEEIAAEKAVEVIACKKVGKDLVAWVKSQEGLMEKLRRAEMLAEVLKLDKEQADFSFKNIQPGQYGDLLIAIPADKAQMTEVVFAAMEFCGDMKFPKDDNGNALVYKLFIELYKHDLASDDALEAWKDDYKRITDHKQKAILQTLKFFEWLLADDEDDEDEDDDEEDDDEELLPEVI